MIDISPGGHTLALNSLDFLELQVFREFLRVARSRGIGAGRRVHRSPVREIGIGVAAITRRSIELVDRYQIAPRRLQIDT